MAVLSELSDDVLVSLLRKGDASAFDVLYNRYWEKLYAMAYNRLKVTQQAEDIVHDVFTLLWQRREEIQPQSLSAYLAAAVKYSVLSHIRKIYSANKYAAMEGQRSQMVPASDNQLHHKRILEMVNQEVDKLPERCRLIFRYSREKGMSAKEIAGALDISVKTVENQLGKALHHLKTSFRNVFSSFFTFFL